MKKVAQKFIRLSSLILLFLFIFYPITYADNIIKVAVLPFQINSSENLDYLKKGILDMLTSRISVEDKIVVLENTRVNEVLSRISESPITEEIIKKIGTQLGVDFIIWGSLTKIGESVSIDAKMFDLKEKKSVTSLFATSKGLDNVIPEISEFALKANSRITGKPYPVYSPSLPPPTASAEASAFMSEFLVSKKGKGTSSDTDSELVMSGDPLRLRRGFWKSQRLDLEIKGVDVGDVDGDGKNETVVMDNNSISIYRYSENRLALIKKIKGKKSDNYLSLDVADIDKNGVSEIFVTNRVGTTMDSFVMEFQKGDFIKIETGIKYFLKVISTSRSTHMLLGQKAGLDGIFYGGVTQLVWKDKKYVEEQDIPLPPGAIVYGFNLIDADKDGKKEIILIDNYDNLKVFSNSGELMWKSDEIYGGTKNFIIKYPSGTKSIDYLEVLETRLYLQNRILVQSHKGENEIIVVRNIPGAGKLFEKTRMYKDSEIYGLTWDGLGLSENWRTKKIYGYIADFQIKDVDNDGKDELVVGIIQTSIGSIFKSDKSYVLVYELMN
ncbi:MAG: VCBS repeat-containing protein [Thermodesulfobacteriota bacterium]